jgi:beta-glucosidase/6-phospho-beta-glucosidase/beta-galactosidase
VLCLCTVVQLSSTQLNPPGAWNVDGKSPSIWDHFLHNKTTNDVTDGATGDVADNFYFSYAQDIPLFRRALGVGTYDFTIAWTRIMPAGRGPLNAKGLEFYQNVIRASNASGMSNICVRRFRRSVLDLRNSSVWY